MEGKGKQVSLRTKAEAGEGVDEIGVVIEMIASNRFVILRGAV